MVVGAVVVAPKVVNGSVEAMGVVGGAVVVMSEERRTASLSTRYVVEKVIFIITAECWQIKGVIIVNVLHTRQRITSYFHLQSIAPEISWCADFDQPSTFGAAGPDRG